MSMVMTIKDMDKDRKNLEDLIAQAGEEIKLNPVEFIQAGNVEYMMQLKKNMDGY